MVETVVGTVRYMSPERLHGEAYGRPADVWGLGLVMIECVAQVRSLRTPRRLSDHKGMIEGSVASRCCFGTDVYGRRVVIGRAFVRMM